MIRRLLALSVLLMGAPALGQDVRYVNDPYEPCEKITEPERYGLSSYKCKGEAGPASATYLLYFELGRWSEPYSRFTILGGDAIETVDRPRASVGSCRAGCTFYQVVSLDIPFDLLLSDEVLRNGLQIKASGGPKDTFVIISASRAQRFHEALVRHNFIRQ